MVLEKDSLTIQVTLLYIQQFTFEGRFVSMFKTSVRYPVSVVAYDCVLYVSHHGDYCLTMYTTSGKYIGCIGGKESATLIVGIPQHLTIDSKGYLYCCNCGKNKVVKLQL